MKYSYEPLKTGGDGGIINTTKAESKGRRGGSKVLPTDEFATYAMIWAHSDKTMVGEENSSIEKENGFYSKNPRMALLRFVHILKSTKILLHRR